MEKILKRIDELISICSVADKDTFNEIKYEIDQLIIDILGKDSESYRNFVSIYNSSLFSWEKCRHSIGILNAIKNYINQSMQNKKYNVFVSSTFIDLKSYRKALADEIVFLGHFAAGMEDFTACGEDLETYIKKVIDEADYYVLMIGQRFGSPIPRNKSVSYTMMEYDYAKSRGMRIIPLIYSGQQTLEGNDLDVNGDKFNRFVESIKKTTPQYFKDENELVRIFSKALHAEMRNYPQKGWIRL